MSVKLAFAAASAIASVAQASAASRNAAAGLASVRSQVAVERSIAETKAAQDEAERSRRLAGVLSSQSALTAGRGIDIGTLDGLRAGDQQQYDRDIGNIQSNKNSKLLQLSMYEADAARQAAYTTRSAWLGAATNIGMIGFNAAGGMGGKPTPTTTTPYGNYGATAGGPR
jgi:hypothetical protein